jgi:hypothetical protein
VSVCTCEFVFVSNYVAVVKFFHDIDFLIDVLLQERFLFDVHFADDFDSVVYIGRF